MEKQEFILRCWLSRVVKTQFMDFAGDCCCCFNCKIKYCSCWLSKLICYKLVALVWKYENTSSSLMSKLVQYCHRNVYYCMIDDFCLAVPSCMATRLSKTSARVSIYFPCWEEIFLLKTHHWFLFILCKRDKYWGTRWWRRTLLLQLIELGLLL